jgi:hypothetical protein
MLLFYMYVKLEGRSKASALFKKPVSDLRVGIDPWAIDLRERRWTDIQTFGRSSHPWVYKKTRPRSQVI